MPILDRRRFLVASAATAASLRSLAQTGGAAAATLTLHPDVVLANVPENFVGLSYEIEQLSDPNFFSVANTGLIAQFRALAPHGVLRLGGNTSDVGWWKATEDATAPAIHVRSVAGEPGENLAYSLGPRAVQNLRQFLEATGWTCLFGINLGTNTPERGAEEAFFVASTLGPRLEYFQIGNEPDLFSHHMRDPKTWSADLYFDEWLKMANAIRARVPSARFGLPDTAGNPEWYAAVVRRLAALTPAERPQIGALSHHYYFGGPPSNPNVNIQRLLQHDPRVDKLADDIRSAAQQLSAATHEPVRYRMTEGNTCYRGGKPGVSDVFAATLWAADYCLTLAADGYAGVNLHGGGGKEVANSLGGTLPGEALMPDPSVPHPRPFYTPIAEMGGSYVAEPVYFGLLFAQQFAGGRMVKVDFRPGQVNATAYAALMPDGSHRIAIVNKDETLGMDVRISGLHKACILPLTAPSLRSHDVHWSADRNAASCPRDVSRFQVPAASALLLESR